MLYNTVHACVVCVLQVAQFQKQCEEYLVIIVSQKREADEQQKVMAVFRHINYFKKQRQHPLSNSIYLKLMNKFHTDT